MLAKGHVISEEDIHRLEIEETHDVWVTQLEEGEIGEDEPSQWGVLLRQVAGQEPRGGQDTQKNSQTFGHLNRNSIANHIK